MAESSTGTTENDTSYLDDLSIHDARTPTAPLRSKPAIVQRFGPFVRRIELWIALAFGIVVLWSLGWLSPHHDDNANPDISPQPLATQLTDNALPPLGANVTGNPRVSDVPLTRHPLPSPGTVPAPTLTPSEPSLSSQTQAASQIAADAKALGASGPSTMNVPPSQQVVPNPEYGQQNAAAAAPTGSDDATGQIMIQGDPQTEEGTSNANSGGGVITGQQAIANEHRTFTSASGTPQYMESVEHDALSQIEVFAGTPLQLHLDDVLVSTLPGQATAHLTKPLRSSLPIMIDGVPRYPIIAPEGSQVIGRYDTDITTGQDRLSAAFDFIELPDGRTIDLGGMAGEEPDGSTGYTAEVDNHTRGLYATIFLATAVNTATALAVPQTSSYTLSPTQVAGASLAQSTGDLMNQRMQQQMSIPPKLTVKTRDFIIRLRSILVVEPYYQRDIDALAKAQAAAGAPAGPPSQ